MQIGAFSKASKISKRMLRYYDEKGLLTPKIDDNGYRQYAASDLNLAEQITELRDLHFQVEEIRRFLESDSQGKKILLEMKYMEVEKDIEFNETVLRRIKSIKDGHNRPKWHNVYNISKFTVEEHWAVQVKGDMTESQMDQVFNDLFQDFLSLPLIKGDYGKPFSIIHDVHDDETFSTTVGLPVFPSDGSVSIEVSLEVSIEEVSLEKNKKLEKIINNKAYEICKYDPIKVIQTIHYGGYDRLSGAYQALHDYADENNFLLKDFYREIYVTDASLVNDAEDYVTLIQAFIE